jgi:hypothetical protein
LVALITRAYFVYTLFAWRLTFFWFFRCLFLGVILSVNVNPAFSFIFLCFFLFFLIVRL